MCAIGMNESGANEVVDDFTSLAQLRELGLGRRRWRGSDRDRIEVGAVTDCGCRLDGRIDGLILPRSWIPGRREYNTSFPGYDLATVEGPDSAITAIESSVIRPSVPQIMKSNNHRLPIAPNETLKAWSAKHSICCEGSTWHLCEIAEDLK